MSNRKNSVYSLVLSAVFAALICAATMLVQIPVPGTGGYANLGDGVILVAAFLLPSVYAVAAAGVGSMLADVLAGYMQFAPGTLVIKALVALVAGLLWRRFGKGKGKTREKILMVVSALIAECVMVIGYFVYESLVLGYGMGAAAALPGNLGQGATGVAIGCTAAMLLMKNKYIQKMT